MTPEQINKLNENPGGKRGLDFIDLIQKDGYVITNYEKVTEIAELVARGSEEPLRSYYSLKDLEKKMGNMEELTTSFRFGMRDLLNEVTAIVTEDKSNIFIDAEGKYTDFAKQFNEIIYDIKSKFGVFQASNRVKEAEESRAKTRAAITALDSNTTMTEEVKNAEFRRLFAIYTGPNVQAIENAKKIANRQDDNFNNNFLDNINGDLKNMHDFLITSQLSSEAKKTLIDKFNKIVAIRNEYRNRLNRYTSNLKVYKNTLTSFGLGLSGKKSEKKVVKPTEPIKEEPVVPVATTPIEPINNTIDSPEPKNDIPKPNDEVKPQRGKKVTAFKKALRKLAKPARLAAVLFLTGAVLLPALGSPFGLVAGALIAVTLEKIVAKKQGLKTNKERKSVKERLTELNDELNKKVSLYSTAPEEKNQLDGFISEIESHLNENFDKEQVAEPVAPDEVDQEVRIAREIMAEEGLTPLEAADKAVEMQVEVPADDEPSLTR